MNDANIITCNSYHTLMIRIIIILLITREGKQYNEKIINYLRNTSAVIFMFTNVCLFSILNFEYHIIFIYKSNFLSQYLTHHNSTTQSQSILKDAQKIMLVR